MYLKERGQKARKGKPLIIAAIITGLATIIAAIVTVILSSQKIGTEKSEKPRALEIRGMVVDNMTNRGIGQVEIGIVGKPEYCITEDNGNFDLNINMDEPRDVRIYAVKSGYKKYDKSIMPPLTQVLIVLNRENK